jgi:hypothetical protein
MEKIGRIEDVSPDANYRFYDVLLGLETIGKIEKRRTIVTDFSKVLCKFARKNEMEICPMVIPDLQNSCIGKEFAWKTAVGLDLLFLLGMMYENGCN